MNKKTKKIVHEMIKLNRENLKKKTKKKLEPLIVSQNNPIRTRYIKANTIIRNKIASLSYVKTQMKQLIQLQAKWHKRSERLGTAGWEWWSTRNCARD